MSFGLLVSMSNNNNWQQSYLRTKHKVLFVFIQQIIYSLISNIIK